MNCEKISSFYDANNEELRLTLALMIGYISETNIKQKISQYIKLINPLNTLMFKDLKLRDHSYPSSYLLILTGRGSARQVHVYIYSRSLSYY